jgi:hypothetical protein
VAVVAAVKVEEAAETGEAQTDTQVQAGAEQATEEQGQRIAAAARCDCEAAGERLPLPCKSSHSTNKPRPRQPLLLGKQARVHLPRRRCRLR